VARSTMGHRVGSGPPTAPPGGKTPGDRLWPRVITVRQRIHELSAVQSWDHAASTCPVPQVGSEGCSGDVHQLPASRKRVSISAPEYAGTPLGHLGLILPESGPHPLPPHPFKGTEKRVASFRRPESVHGVVGHGQPARIPCAGAPETSVGRRRTPGSAGNGSNGMVFGRNLPCRFSGPVSMLG